jgi:uncharacterized protein YbjQ (UPF0145 family)
MIVTSTDKISGKGVKELLSRVNGCCVQTKFIEKDLRAAGMTY